MANTNTPTITVNPIGQCSSRDLRTIKRAALNKKPDADPLREAANILKIARSRLYDHHTDLLDLTVGTTHLRFRRTR